MPLDVIGAGFGRTGTFSLRTALNKLGFPCYHMMDVLFDPAHKSDVDFWLEVAEDPARADRDWTRVFAGVSATVDYPACAAWRGMVAANPQAKVIATLHPRGAAAWFESTRNTIYAGTGLDAGSCFGAKINAMMDRLVWHGMLQGTMEHRAAAMARYENHLQDLRDSLPADQLLVFSVDQGWEPLCRFLGVPVPQEEFPNVNEREHMARVTARLMRMRQLAEAQAPKG